MDLSCLVTTVQAAGGGVMVWGMFSWQTLGPLVPNGLQKCHKAGIISNWFLEHNNEFTVLKWPPQSPDPNRPNRAYLGCGGMRAWSPACVYPTNLHQLQDAMGQHF